MYVCGQCGQTMGGALQRVQAWRGCRLGEGANFILAEVVIIDFLALSSRESSLMLTLP